MERKKYELYAASGFNFDLYNEINFCTFNYALPFHHSVKHPFAGRCGQLIFIAAYHKADLFITTYGAPVPTRHSCNCLPQYLCARPMPIVEPLASVPPVCGSD